MKTFLLSLATAIATCVFIKEYVGETVCTDVEYPIKIQSPGNKDTYTPFKVKYCTDISKEELYKKYINNMIGIEDK